MKSRCHGIFPLFLGNTPWEVHLAGVGSWSVSGVDLVSYRRPGGGAAVRRSRKSPRWLTVTNCGQRIQASSPCSRYQRQVDRTEQGGSASTTGGSCSIILWTSVQRVRLKWAQRDSSHFAAIRNTSAGSKSHKLVVATSRPWLQRLDKRPRALQRTQG